VKRLLITCLIAIFGIVSFSLPFHVDAKTSVRGYIKRSGTYVIPHYRTSPNKIKTDNWSSKGNYNPYTGKKGYKRLY
jgi:hypothetical protein